MKALEALQKVDAEILELSRSGEANPKRLAELDRELEQARSAWEVEQGKVTENEKQRRDLEAQLQAEKETIRKWEGRLSEQRTPREYSALSREIDIARKNIENIEHQIIELRQAVGELERVAAQRQQTFRERQQTVGREASEIKKKIAALEERLATLGTQREQAMQGCDKPLLGRYEIIRKKRGLALVPVIGGTCRGCHMSLPPQLYNQLRSGQAAIESCPSCHRLIYVPDPPPEAPAG
ncbi:MAG: zinc ribbon domain-containing protein [Myxococcales bacterium]